MHVAANSLENLHDATRSQIRGSGMLLAGKFFSLAIGFVPHVLLVRYLITADYGLWAYVLSVVSICQTLAQCFNETMMRFVSIFIQKREHNKLLGTIALVFGITALISVVFIAALYAAPAQISRFLTHGKQSLDLLLIMIFMVPTGALDHLLTSLFACFSLPRAIFLGKYVITPSLRFAAVLLLILSHSGLRFLASAYLVAGVLTILVYGWFILDKLRSRSAFGKWVTTRMDVPVREILYFSAPLISSNLVEGMLEGSVIVLFLGYFQDLSAIAFYRVVLPVAALHYVVMTGFTMLYIPAASRMYANGDYEGINDLYWQTAAWMGMLAFPIFLATFCFSEPLTVFLYGSRYAQSGTILAFLALGHYVQVVFGFNGLTLKAVGKVGLTALISVTIAVTGLLLNFLLIPRHGAKGAAIATAITLIWGNLLKQTALHFACGISIFDRQYYPFYMIIASSALGVFLLESYVHISSIYLVIGISALVSFLVLTATRKTLRVEETFPESRRLFVLNKLMDRV